MEKYRNDNDEEETDLPIHSYVRLLSGILAVSFLYITFILSYSIYQFAAFGGNYQLKFHDLIVSKVE
mgnify:CR=1 FL=1